MSVVPQPPSYQEAQILAQAQAQAQAQAHTQAAHAQAQAQTVVSGTSIVQDVGGGTLIAVSQPLCSSPQSDIDAVQADGYKNGIYRHPLFPLMALLFEKCEQASHSTDYPTSDSFDVDIQAFVRHQEKENKTFFSEDNELDNLMVKAIQVLRIHLLELEKVNDLCKDFCSRYIACLKGKLQSENLLRIDNLYDDPSPPLPGTPQPSPAVNQMQVPPQVMTPGVVTSVNGNTMVIQQGLPSNTVSMATISQGQIVSGNTVYQMVQTPQGIVAQPVQLQNAAQVHTPITPSATVIHGNTPLSQIGMVGTPVTPQVNTPTAPAVSQAHTHSFPSQAHLNALFDDDDMSKRKNKRGVLPKQATQVMKTWLFQHIVHPYPTEDEKRQIAGQTNLTLLQVNNWFINARRRILQPMLDASNPETTKAKKSKPQTRPQQRFWPDSIANITPQLPMATVLGDGQSDDKSPQQVIMSEGQDGSPVLLTGVTEQTVSLPQLQTSSSNSPNDGIIKTEIFEGAGDSSSSKDD